MTVLMSLSLGSAAPGPFSCRASGLILLETDRGRRLCAVTGLTPTSVGLLLLSLASTKAKDCIFLLLHFQNGVRILYLSGGRFLGLVVLFSFEIEI